MKKTYKVVEYKDCEKCSAGYLLLKHGTELPAEKIYQNIISKKLYINAISVPSPCQGCGDCGGHMCEVVENE